VSGGRVFPMSSVVWRNPNVLCKDEGQVIDHPRLTSLVWQPQPSQHNFGPCVQSFTFPSEITVCAFDAE